MRVRGAKTTQMLKIAIKGAVRGLIPIGIRTRVAGSERASTGGGSARLWFAGGEGGHGGGCQGPEWDGLCEAKLVTVVAAPEVRDRKSVV